MPMLLLLCCITNEYYLYAICIFAKNGFLSVHSICVISVDVCVCTYIFYLLRFLAIEMRIEIFSVSIVRLYAYTNTFYVHFVSFGFMTGSSLA